MSTSPRASARKQSGASCSLIVRVEPRMGPPQLGRGGRRQLGQRRREPGDPHRADDPVRVGRDVGRRGLELREHEVGVADEHLGGAGEPHAAPVALEHGLADLALQRRELLRHRGGREVERLGGGRQGPLLGDLAQDTQAAGVDHAASLTDPERNVYWI